MGVPWSSANGPRVPTTAQATTAETTPIASPPGFPEGGFRHEAALFDRDEDLIAIVQPFLAAGLAAGEPTILVVGTSCAAQLRSTVPDFDELIVIPVSEALRRPALRLQTLRRTLDVHLAAGAARVRVVSSLPVDAADPFAIAWQPWARYEAYLEVALADAPVWHLCLYDRRTAGAEALVHAERVHTHLATFEDGHRELTDRPTPLPVLASLLTLDVPANGSGEPVAEVIDPSPAAARRTTAEVAAQTSLDDDDREGLVAAVSEVVTNAHRYGRGPVVLCAWRGDSEVVVAVTDHGDGPQDPAVGLAPVEREPGEGGFGLWIANQLCRSVTLHRGPGSFTVRLLARSGDGP